MKSQLDRRLARLEHTVKGKAWKGIAIFDQDAGDPDLWRRNGEVLTTEQKNLRFAGYFQIEVIRQH